MGLTVSLHRRLSTWKLPTARHKQSTQESAAPAQHTQKRTKSLHLQMKFNVTEAYEGSSTDPDDAGRANLTTKSECAMSN